MANEKKIKIFSFFSTISFDTIKRLLKYLPITSLLFFACDNNVVSRVEYDAVLSRADELEACNDSLQFELSNLRLYNEYLEKILDTLEHQR